MCIVILSLLAHKNASNAKADRMKELDAIRNRHDQKKMKLSMNPEINIVPPEEVESEESESEVEDDVCQPPVPPPMPSSLCSSPMSNSPMRNSPMKNSPMRNTPMKNSPMKNSPLKAYAGLKDVRPIRVSPPKPGKMYPCLSDIEMTTEYESDEEVEEMNRSRK